MPGSFPAWIIVALLAAFSSACAAAAERPGPPPSDIPAPAPLRSGILCAGCDEPFDTVTHKELLEQLLANPYAGELRKALYLQDSLHQFESRAHFDNCDFDAATRYVDDLLAEVGSHVERARQARTDGNGSHFVASVKSAFFALGQALHGVQDFYAHTNYVELQVDAVDRVTELALVLPWREDGKARIQRLQGEGLVSGHVFWGVPQVCPTGTPSHGDLAKDSETTKSGAVRVAHLRNISRYRIAVFLARETSLKFMEDAFKRWPLLKEVNGPHVLLDFLIDRRPE